VHDARRTMHDARTAERAAPAGAGTAGPAQHALERAQRQAPGACATRSGGCTTTGPRAAGHLARLRRPFDQQSRGA